jgi:hypothetical protein
VVNTSWFGSIADVDLSVAMPVVADVVAKELERATKNAQLAKSLTPSAKKNRQSKTKKRSHKKKTKATRVNPTRLAKDKTAKERKANKRQRKAEKRVVIIPTRWLDAVRVYRQLISVIRQNLPPEFDYDTLACMCAGPEHVAIPQHLHPTDWPQWATQTRAIPTNCAATLTQHVQKLAEREHQAPVNSEPAQPYQPPSPPRPKRQRTLATEKSLRSIITRAAQIIEAENEANQSKHPQPDRTQSHQSQVHPSTLATPSPLQAANSSSTLPTDPTNHGGGGGGMGIAKRVALFQTPTRPAAYPDVQAEQAYYIREFLEPPPRALPSPPDQQIAEEMPPSPQPQDLVWYYNQHEADEITSQTSQASPTLQQQPQGSLAAYLEQHRQPTSYDQAEPAYLSKDHMPQHIATPTRRPLHASRSHEMLAITHPAVYTSPSLEYSQEPPQRRASSYDLTSQRHQPNVGLPSHPTTPSPPATQATNPTQATATKNSGSNNTRRTGGLSIPACQATVPIVTALLDTRPTDQPTYVPPNSDLAWLRAWLPDYTPPSTLRMRYPPAQNVDDQDHTDLFLVPRLDPLKATLEQAMVVWPQAHIPTALSDHLSTPAPTLVPNSVAIVIADEQADVGQCCDLVASHLRQYPDILTLCGVHLSPGSTIASAMASRYHYLHRRVDLPRRLGTRPPTPAARAHLLNRLLVNMADHVLVITCDATRPRPPPADYRRISDVAACNYARMRARTQLPNSQLYTNLVAQYQAIVHTNNPATQASSPPPLDLLHSLPGDPGYPVTQNATYAPSKAEYYHAHNPVDQDPGDAVINLILQARQANKPIWLLRCHPAIPRELV